MAKQGQITGKSRQEIKQIGLENRNYKLRKQSTKLHIGISTELKLKLQERAEECSMTLNQYCLFILSNTRFKAEIPD